MLRTPNEWASYYHYPHSAFLRIALERLVFHQPRYKHYVDKEVMSIIEYLNLHLSAEMLEIVDTSDLAYFDIITEMKKEVENDDVITGVSYAPIFYNWREIHIVDDFLKDTEYHTIVLETPHYSISYIGGLAFIFINHGVIYRMRITNDELGCIVSDTHADKKTFHVIDYLMTEFNNYLYGTD